MDPNTKHRNLRRKWRGWVTRVEQELTNPVISRHIYNQVRKIVLANPDIRRPSDFHIWLVHNYFVATSVGIRRLTDADARSVSLTRLLHDIQRHSCALTRVSYVRPFPVWLKHAGSRQFDRFAGPGNTSLDPRIPQDDLKRIETKEKRIRKFVNKRVAHLDRRNRRFRPQRFDELDSMITLLERLFLKYKLLLTGISISSNTLLPTWAYDWKAILREPWLRDA